MIPPLVLQTAGSLIAILALVGLAWWLKLGTEPLLDSDAAVRRAAGEVEEVRTGRCIPAGQSAIAAIRTPRHGDTPSRQPFCRAGARPAARARIDATDWS